MRFGIQKKLLLLIALLSLALIVASVLVSSRMYAASMERNTRDLCFETADSLADSLASNMDFSDFMEKYISKVEEAYLNNREELEAASEVTFESYDKRAEFYDRFTEGIFPPKSGLGLSYEALVFKNSYQAVLNNMDMLSYAGGLDVSSIFIYDRAHGNIVYLIDRQPEGSQLYNFPVSVRKPWNKQLEAALESGSESSFTAESESYAIKALEGSKDVYVLFVKQNSDVVQNVRTFTTYVGGILLGATLLIGLFTLLFAQRLITGNIKKLSKASEQFTSQIGGGTPEKVSAAINSRDEIGDLSEKFDLMQDSILGYISSLEEKTAKEEKMKAELDLAASIQSESLPKDALKLGSVTLESFLKPAREVGGDLYDYFMLDENRLFFCLADVSGKGVPAALFMMRAKELIKAGADRAESLSELAYATNNRLCSGNFESIFITAFFGVFDTVSGKLTYLRAGHEQPLIKRGDGIIRISEESNCVLGVFEDMEYVAEETVLLPGDTLFMFTDGLDEGINEERQAFGYERIESVLRETDTDIANAMFKSLSDFCGGAEQFDDVTMLVLGFGKKLRLDIDSPCFGDITAVTDRVQSALSGCSPDRVSEAGLIVDEVMNNQISYGFDGVKAPHITVTLELFRDEAALTFEDNGVAFDPLAESAENAAEVSESGFGIMLVKELSDGLSYTREGGLNRLTVRKSMRG